VDERWQVGAEQAGRRLDAWLADRLPVSRAQARGLLRRGQVHVNGRAADETDKGLALRAGDEIAVTSFVPPALQLPEAQADLAVPVLADGGDAGGWLVLDKPAGMPVHPLSPDERGTLLNHAIALRPQLAGVGEGGLRSGVVHRLDVETSGCVAVATTQATWQALRRAFAGHDATKVYHALVRGRLTGEGRDDLWLHVAQHRPARVRVAADPDACPGARRCTQTWRAIETGRDHTRVEIHLGTGFLHQIRAIFAHRGHPVLGDPVYGDHCNAPRLMLHAVQLTVGPVHAVSPDPLQL
jgi:23S rRNA pseudouridine1911/1915/1917 synthase